MENELMPQGLKYNTNYSWIRVEEGIAAVGVTKIFVDSVKEFVFIELPKKGPIAKDETYVTLESVKWSGHLVSPVSGEIVDVNEGLFDEPSRLNGKPYEEWIMKIKLSNKDELGELLTADQAISKSTYQVK